MYFWTILKASFNKKSTTSTYGFSKCDLYLYIKKYKYLLYYTKFKKRTLIQIQINKKMTMRSLATQFYQNRRRHNFTCNYSFKKAK